MSVVPNIAYLDLFGTFDPVTQAYKVQMSWNFHKRSNILVSMPYQRMKLIVKFLRLALFFLPPTLFKDGFFKNTKAKKIVR